MEQFGVVAEALAVLMWPLIVLLVILRFSPAVKSLIESGRSRAFTLRIGGQELTMEEANQQQAHMIADLQAQLGTLRARLEGRTDRESSQPGYEALPTSELPSVRRVLWVDDRPKNNSYFIEQLRDGGIDVDLALSTEEGFAQLEQRPYGAVVSDIGRFEDGSFAKDAGLDFLRRLRGFGETLPFAFFTSNSRARSLRDEAIESGANVITGSGTELVQFFLEHFPGWSPGPP